MRPEEIVEVYISKRIADKIWAKHAVAEEEVYEVFENVDDVVKIRRSAVTAGSYLAYGRTLAGRYLVVALFPKRKGRVNVATARDMTDAERHLY
ncbi:MAG: hypothetical protein M3347_05425, partial [Armatimonadota bacterium]|nr:hypothetical protein [Armatimonadota bacterium]